MILYHIITALKPRATPFLSLLLYLGDIGHEVIGDALGILADAARGVGAYGVEISQQHCIPGLWDAGQTMGVGGAGCVSQLNPEPTLPVLYP